MDTQLVGEDDGDEWAVDRIYLITVLVRKLLLRYSGNLATSLGFLTIKSLTFKP